MRAFDPPKTLHKSNTGPRGAPREPEGGLGGPGVGKGGGLRPPTHPQKSAFGLRVDKAYSGHGFGRRFFGGIWDEVEDLEAA